MRARTAAALCACLAVVGALQEPPAAKVERTWWSGAAQSLPWSKSPKEAPAPAEPPKRKRRRKGPSMVAVCIFIGFCLLVLEQGLASPENNLLGRLATLRPGLYSAREVVTGLAATLLLPAIAVFSFGFVVAKALGLVRPPPSMPSPDASPNGSPTARAADRNQHGWDANDSAFSLDDPAG